ncbi:hypothetical protein VIGAN_08340500, partial [Vigna angularis var. angularis]
GALGHMPLNILSLWGKGKDAIAKTCFAVWVPQKLLGIFALSLLTSDIATFINQGKDPFNHFHQQQHQQLTDMFLLLKCDR